MDSYHPPHHYMRPPPPPPSSMPGDPHLQHYPAQPPPPPGSWFSSQFQYHTSHSPSPPPPHQHQWAPPPPPPPYAPYQPPQQHQQQPPPYSHPHPHPPPPPNHPYPNPNPNQDWGNANWSHSSGWEYPGHSNEEDWAAKARAWASARSAMENQHPQSQFAPMAPQDERPLYSNQYSQPVESHYQDVQHSSVPTSSFQHYQPPVAPLNRPPMAHQHEHAPISSYGPDGHFSFSSKDGAPGGGDLTAAFPHHQGPSSSSVHQQEVPSSYSSAPGNHEDLEGRQYGHSLSVDGRAGPTDQGQFPYSNHSLHPMDQPLEFAPRFSHENDPKMRSSYPDSLGSAKGTDTCVASSLHPWTTPAVPGGPYPPMAPAFPLPPQDDPSMGVPPFPGQPPAPMFERASSFPPAVPPVGLGGATLQPPAAFPMDAYGASLSAERPKKAAVPNWLREEIIKNKPTLTTSASEHLKEGSESVDDEPLDKSTGKGDLADSKSMDSSKSTEEEDDDEDDQEVQRIAAMNQEIKRVLTEVLLKVTDEMFDEIATRVLNETDATIDAIPEPENGARNQKLSPPPPPVPVPKASAKVLVPIKAKEPVSGNASTESSSGSPGNVLGLANYDSDDDDDGENPTSTAPKAENDGPYGAGENGRAVLEADHSRTEGDAHRSSVLKLNDKRMGDKSLDNNGDHRAKSDETSRTKSDDVKSVDNAGKAGIIDGDIPAARHNSRKSSENDSQERHQKKDDRVESHGKRDERHQKKDKEEDHHNITKERSKEPRGKDRDNKARDSSDSRKRSPHRDSKDSKKERDRDRDRKASSKDDAERKRERSKDEKDDRSRHKSSRRHKRRRSTSVGHRSKHSKGSPVDSEGSSGQASDDSRRKANPKRRDLSPSPVRSKHRQVSRSPHSKRSQRRHSPYSSLDGSRERRSRSRSPVRRQR